MIRKGDKLYTHLEGSFTVVKTPRIWAPEEKVVLRSDTTGELRTTRLPHLFNALQNNYYSHSTGNSMTQDSSFFSSWPVLAAGILTGVVVIASLTAASMDPPPEQPTEAVQLTVETPKNSACGIAEPWSRTQTPVDGYRCFVWTRTTSREWPDHNQYTEVAGVACFPEEEVDTALPAACK